MAKKTIELNKAQLRVIGMLERALMACERENVYLWDDYGTISAVNGNHVSNVEPDYMLDEPLNRNDVFTVPARCWRGSNADDDLYIKWKRRNRRAS